MEDQALAALRPKRLARPAASPAVAPGSAAALDAELDDAPAAALDDAPDEVFPEDLWFWWPELHNLHVFGGPDGVGEDLGVRRDFGRKLQFVSGTSDLHP